MKLESALFLVLCLLLISAFISPAAVSAKEYSMGNFDPYTSKYSYGQFADVNESAWYGLEGQGVVSTACGLGLMNGTGNGFSPEGSLTIAQAVTMAARLCSIYCGDSYRFVQGSPWYQCYVDYAEDHNILYEGEFSDEMEHIATRAEMAYIFYYALPEDELQQINTVSSLPDVNSDTDYSDFIFFMYNAGILTGNEAYGTFTPYSPITRAAAAAIVSRMALPELRKEFTLSSPPSSVVSNPASLLDYSHYNVTKPAAINNYNDFVQAWEWMLVNTVFNASFSSGISCTLSDIDGLQDAAIEAYSLVAGFEYFDYASFRRSVGISTSYSYTASGKCYDIRFDLELTNVDGISNSAIANQVAAFEDTCANIITSLYSTGELSPSMTNREKALVLYEYVILNNAYDGTYTRYTGYDAAVRRSSVCQGYAGMYSYLCNLAGVPMRGITGQASGDSHAWNRIYEDGQWYHIDTTFGDPYPDTPGFCDYSWFWLTEGQLRYGSNPRTMDTDKLVYVGTFSHESSGPVPMGVFLPQNAPSEYAA